MDIDPRMAERLRQTLATRLDQYEAEAAHGISDLIEVRRCLGSTGRGDLYRIAAGLETFQEIMHQHPAHTPEGKLVRNRFATAIADLHKHLSELVESSQRDP